MSEHTNPSSSDSDAKFLGWQKTGSGEVFALYNITAAGDPSLGSTVTDKTLHKLNLQVPGAPLPQGPDKKF
jgi:hypothetical protein